MHIHIGLEPILGNDQSQSKVGSARLGPWNPYPDSQTPLFPNAPLQNFLPFLYKTLFPSTKKKNLQLFPDSIFPAFLPPVTAFRIRYSSNMGLLDLLWDDTVAGPQPDNGLSKLRKYRTLSCSARSLDFSDDIPVTRSITILKTSHFRNVSGDTGSLPSSPAGSSAPDSPLTRVHSIFLFSMDFAFSFLVCWSVTVFSCPFQRRHHECVSRESGGNLNRSKRQNPGAQPSMIGQ